MAKVLRMRDRARLKIKDVEFTWAPLSEKNRIELRSATKIVNGKETSDIYRQNSMLLKFTLKEIRGVEDYEGRPYALEFDEDGYLTDDCISEVRSIEFTDEYLTAAWQMLASIPEKLVDPMTGEELEGVALELLRQGAPSG